MFPDNSERPNILFIMCDQMRFDVISALGDQITYTPNLDRLVRRGVVFENAYSTCPVCLPARCTIRTGCEPPATGFYFNTCEPYLLESQPEDTQERCGDYLGRTMTRLGYRTFGIGKFHSLPEYGDLGYELQLNSEEIYGSKEQRAKDSFAAFIDNEHPEYSWIEQLMGERTEMYYMPQMSPLPTELNQEAWASDRAIEQIQKEDKRPYFGFVSFVGPHPPLAPPIPFNRIYDPDKMSAPVCGSLEVDHMDEQIPWMNYAVFADDISDFQAKALKARYYGEVSYIDQCIGKILDAVETGPDADNTLICFFSDHGDHLGDHHAWQKESFFEASCRIPFLVSWPRQLSGGMRRSELVSIADLFGIATAAAGCSESRDGIDILGMLSGNVDPRSHLIGYYGLPGTDQFKIMVRQDQWKYIFMANGGREQMFDLSRDTDEIDECLNRFSDIADRLRRIAIDSLVLSNACAAVDNTKALRSFPFTARPLSRIYQFAYQAGSGFPSNPHIPF
ncbi:MAG: sulfatase family protein [Armatimonadota bacterium]